MELEVIKCLPTTNSTFPPLLFVHGAHHGAWCWEETFLPFFAEKGYPAYAVSLRGHGNSYGFENLDLYSLEDYMDDVLHVIGLMEAKPILIGHSMGGAIVQKIHQQYSDRIIAMVLMASLPHEGMLLIWLRLLFTKFNEVIKLLFKIKSKKIGSNVDPFFSSSLPLRKRIQYLLKLKPESSKARRQMLFRIVPKSRISKVPSLVLGSEQDWYFTGKTTLRIGRAYGATTVVFPDISHDMMLDPKWKNVSENILLFLDNLEISKGD
ncbi:alpha/beta hydrolase [Paenibacillus taichungensis]|uniref:alpha/beta hydrolase n=1 Tax=Paenibacillus taichungensis TaxID=484184 RepID=UPI0038D1083D